VDGVLGNKNEAFKCFIRVKASAETESNCKLKALRSD
jgi:hypothetical protein